MNHTVETLRKSGHKVRVTHFRYGRVQGYNSLIGHYDTELCRAAHELRDLDGEFYPDGGATMVEVSLSNGIDCGALVEFEQGQNYNKKVGVAQALEAALRTAGYTVKMEETYPILKKSKSGIIVLFDGPRRGTVVSKGDSVTVSVGERYNTIAEECFETLDATQGVVIRNRVL